MGNFESSTGSIFDSWVNSSRLRWEPSLPKEREPQYSGRVLVPRLRWLVSMEQDFSAVVKGDGIGQQSCDPVFLGGKRYVPDISMLGSGGERTAIEVKFFDGKASRLKEAMGQALIYLSGNYDTVRVLLVSITGQPNLSDTDMKTLNDAVPGARFGCHELVESS